jgi:hypothetical protein
LQENFIISPSAEIPPSAILLTQNFDYGHSSFAQNDSDGQASACKQIIDFQEYSFLG